MGTLLATRMKNRRKALKLSQKELAEGICQQAQISRLENGEYTPGSELLHDLAKKLKVSMDYFFDEDMLGESIELLEFKKIAKTFITQRKYDSLNYVYQLEQKTWHRLSLSDKIYMDWIGSLVDFYHYDRREEAIVTLERLLHSLNEVDLNYLQISNTLFNFYYDTKKIDRFDAIKEKLTIQIERLNIVTIEELELFVKFNYNLSRYLWLQNEVEEAAKQIIATIKSCQHYKTTYLLGDLFLLLGNVSMNFSDTLTVKEYFENAQFIYSKLDENKEMAITVEHYIAENF
ncbi:UNVERIFIED_CONTAM: helix-turn-helix transcriptional regulator [Streptococcus canis]